MPSTGTRPPEAIRPMVAWGCQINLREASGSTPEAIHDRHVYVHEPINSPTDSISLP
jgi:hypothetical protein